MNRFPVLVLAWLLMVASTMAAAQTLPDGIIAVSGRNATGFTLTDMDGKPASLRPGSGTWSFVHFWASWCGPCRREMPAIGALVEAMQDQSLQFYIINTAENEDTVFTFLAATAPDLNSLLDRDGLVTEQWQPRGLPATYLVDPDGRIRYQALGGRDWNKDEYRQFLQRLLTNQ